MTVNEFIEFRLLNKFIKKDLHKYNIDNDVTSRFVNEDLSHIIFGLGDDLFSKYRNYEIMIRYRKRMIRIYIGDLFIIFNPNDKSIEYRGNKYDSYYHLWNMNELHMNYNHLPIEGYIHINKDKDPFVNKFLIHLIKSQKIDEKRLAFNKFESDKDNEFPSFILDETLTKINHYTFYRNYEGYEVYMYDCTKKLFSGKPKSNRFIINKFNRYNDRTWVHKYRIPMLRTKPINKNK